MLYAQKFCYVENMGTFEVGTGWKMSTRVVKVCVAMSNVHLRLDKYIA